MRATHDLLKRRRPILLHRNKGSRPRCKNPPPGFIRGRGKHRLVGDSAVDFSGETFLLIQVSSRRRGSVLVRLYPSGQNLKKKFPALVGCQSGAADLGLKKRSEVQVCEVNNTLKSNLLRSGHQRSSSVPTSLSGIRRETGTAPVNFTPSRPSREAASSGSTPARTATPSASNLAFSSCAS